MSKNEVERLKRALLGIEKMAREYEKISLFIPDTAQEAECLRVAAGCMWDRLERES